MRGVCPALLFLRKYVDARPANLYNTNIRNLFTEGACVIVKNDEFLEKEFDFNNAMKNPYANELNKAAAVGSANSVCAEENMPHSQNETGSVDAEKSGAL